MRGLTPTWLDWASRRGLADSGYSSFFEAEELPMPSDSLNPIHIPLISEINCLNGPNRVPYYWAYRLASLSTPWFSPGGGYSPHFHFQFYVPQLSR